MTDLLVRKCSGCFLDYPKYKCCEDTYYCGKDCQKKQWDLHKNYCKATGALKLKNVDAKVLNIIKFLSYNMPKLCEKLSEHYEKNDSLYIFHISFNVIEKKSNIKDESKKENGKEEEGDEKEEKEEKEEKDEEKNSSIFSEFGNWRYLQTQRLEKERYKKNHDIITSLFKDENEAKFKVIIMFDTIRKNIIRKKYLYIYDPRIVKTTYFLNVTHEDFYKKISILNRSFWSSRVVFDSYITKTALEHFNDLERNVE